MSGEKIGREATGATERSAWDMLREVEMGQEKNVYNLKDESVRGVVGDFIEKVHDEDLDNLRNEISNDYESGARYAVEYFAQVLGLKLVPRLSVTKRLKGRAIGVATRRYEEDIGLVTTIRLARFLPPRVLGEDLRAVSAEKMLGTVAHESWHCWQHQLADRILHPENYEDGNEIDENRAMRYIYNFENYIQGQDDPVGYRNQLVEVEAYSFGRQICEKLKSW